MRRIVAACVLLFAGCGVLAQTPLGDFRWMPIDPMQGPRRTADGAAMEKGLLGLVERVRALPLLNPPPGVFPKASLSMESTQAPAPHTGVIMFGFWPPGMTRVRNGVPASAGELMHLMVYVNAVREEAFNRTFWADAEGPLLTQPALLGQLQGFPVYEGAGGTEVSGIMVVQPPGRSLFAPVSRERFHAFEVTDLERQIKEGAPALKAAQDKYNGLVSAEGRAAQEKRIADSLAQYEKTRPRTPEQMRNRERDIRRLEAEEEARLRTDATAEGNRLLGPLAQRLAKARAALAALGDTERAQPACHAPDSRVTGPHPVPTGTPGCVPVVSVARWYNPSLPRSTWQLITVERYWPSLKEVQRGTARDDRGIYYHINKEVTEALDWKAIQSLLK